jgi:hypothetical protein
VIIFAADDPLVVNGTYDREGFKPGERARIAKARAQHAKGSPRMAKTTKKRASKMDRKLTQPDAPAPKRRGRPRQADLPGTEDRAIKALEDAAGAYADIRDQRIALNVDEAKLKSQVLTLMHKHGKTIYQRDGITITIIPEQETVKVKVRKPGDDDEEQDDTPPQLGEEFAEERAAAVNAED